MFTLREIAFITGGSAKNLNPDHRVTAFSIDSRSILPNSVFFALKGEKFDGVQFVKEALEKGAEAVVVPYGTNIDPSLPAIYVDDVILSMARLARAKIRRMKSKVIGVTGSIGKTTTKELIYSLLSSKYTVFKSKKSFNNHIGLPLTILEAPEHVDFLILEYGTNHPGEISYLTSIANPDLAIITKIGTAHIEFFKTQKNIALEKGTLFRDLKPGGVAFLNTSTPYFDLLYSMVPYTAKKVTFGVESGDVRPEWFKSDYLLTTFEYKGIRFQFTLPGKGMLENVVGAIAIGEYLGVPLEDMQNTLKEFKGEKMRMEVSKIKEVTVVNDAYNANPDSMQALLETFKESPYRAIFVLGDMLELGEKAEEEHRRIGRIFAELGHKILVTTGNLAKFIAEEAKKAGVEEVYHFETKEEVVEFLKDYLKPGDHLILKASRACQFEEIQKTLEELL